MAGYREILSGRKRGVLACAETVYGSAVSWRNRRYDGGGKTVHRVPATVISVGNITTGGTGKTPFVAWLVNWFNRRELTVAILSRGYGAKPGEANDEALELEARLPQTPHIQNADRVAGARQAIEQSDARVLVLDDAFQHRRIDRDLDIVLIDALEPFGYSHMLPRGLLREPLSSLRRAQVIALSRADLVSDDQREKIFEIVQQHAPRALWLEVAHRPQCLVGTVKSDEFTIDTVRGKRVAAFCGLGNPHGFQRTLEQLGINTIDFVAFPDHHAYSQKELERLSKKFDELDIDLIVCTMKDFVKLQCNKIGRHPLRALRIDIEILAGRAAFELQLDELIARKNKT